jgi:hypothetical protein
MLNRKPDSSAALAAFLAKGGKVTTCPPAEGNAVPLRRLRKLAEECPTGRPLGSQGRLDTGRTVRSSESYAEEDAEILGAAMAAGVGTDAALEELNYVRSRRR